MKGNLFLQTCRLEGSKKVRPDLPARPTFRTGSIGARSGNDEDFDGYQLHGGIEAKVAVMFWDGERILGEEEAFKDGSPQRQ